MTPTDFYLKQKIDRHGWMNFLDDDYFTSFNLFDPKPIRVGEINVGYLNTGDAIITAENYIKIHYQDGTKWTINRSWFEGSERTERN